jgi:glycosyltransferase involved in cell wall biosynthesis
VLLQGYPDLEYIIIDGGSKDESVEITKKYEPWLSYWVSEPDRGQAHAINKGFRLATGDIRAWLNSDDLYLLQTFSFVGQHFFSSPNHHWLVGGLQYMDHESSLIETLSPSPRDLATIPLFKNDNRYLYDIWQPSSFWSTELWNNAGPLDERLNYCMDLMFWFESFAKGFNAFWVERPLAAFRLHATSKSTTDRLKFSLERFSIHRRVAWRQEYHLISNLNCARKHLTAALLQMTDQCLANQEPMRASVWLSLAMLQSPNIIRRRLYTWKQIFKLV